MIPTFHSTKKLTILKGGTMKRQTLPGKRDTGGIFKLFVMLLCLAVSGWMGFAGTGSPDFQLDRLQTLMKDGSNEFLRSYSDAMLLGNYSTILANYAFDSELRRSRP